MSELRQKLNIKKITLKNLFLLVLMVIAMAIIGVITKSIGRNATNINVAQAQSCWTPPLSGSCTSCDGQGTAGDAGDGGGGTGACCGDSGCADADSAADCIV